MVWEPVLPVWLARTIWRMVIDDAGARYTLVKGIFVTIIEQKACAMSEQLRLIWGECLVALAYIPLAEVVWQEPAMALKIGESVLHFACGELLLLR